jgi:hypothetical protein
VLLELVEDRPRLEVLSFEEGEEEDDDGDDIDTEFLDEIFLTFGSGASLCVTFAVFSGGRNCC